MGSFPGGGACAGGGACGGGAGGGAGPPPDGGGLRPPREFLLFKHPKRTTTLSMRNTSVMKKGGVFSAEFLKVFLPSLLLSHLLAIGLG